MVFSYRERTSPQGPILRLKFIDIYLYCLLLCPSLKFMKEKRNLRLEIWRDSSRSTHKTSYAVKAAQIVKYPFSKIVPNIISLSTTACAIWRFSQCEAYRAEGSHLGGAPADPPAWLGVNPSCWKNCHLVSLLQRTGVGAKYYLPEAAHRKRQKSRRPMFVIGLPSPHIQRKVKQAGPVMTTCAFSFYKVFLYTAPVQYSISCEAKSSRRKVCVKEHVDDILKHLQNIMFEDSVR